MATNIARCVAVFSSIAVSAAAVSEDSLDRTGAQWTPALEWSLPNSSYEGNPYDLAATVTFRHEESGEEHTTGMYFDGDDT